MNRKHSVHKDEQDLSTKYSQESQLEQSLLNAVGPFWQSRDEGYIQGQNDKNIFWVSMTNPEHTKAIVVVNGRIESVWKYQELFFELYQQGYDVYSFDHRGQGLSDRMHTDPHLGHVEDFENYILDMNEVIQSFPLEKYQHRYLLAHSMGGAITTRYLETQEHSFDAVALSAPMHGISMSWYLKPIAYNLAQVCIKVNKKPHYAPGQTCYQTQKFEENNLTQSLKRYQIFRVLYEKMPELQLGGPSSHWVSEAIKASNDCIEDAHKINIPVLLLQAGDDSIVDNKAQVQFMQAFNQAEPPGELIKMEHSQHEILFEKDEIRDKALDIVFDFFQQQSKSSASKNEEG